MKKSNLLSAVLVFTFLFGTVQIGMTSNKSLEEAIVSAVSGYYDQQFDYNIDPRGVVAVKGIVPTLYDKYRIFDIISSVNGVTEIKDLLNVDTSDLPDNIVKQNVKNELKMVSAIKEPDRIHVTVDNGLVFLSGEVSYYREKLMAQTVVSWQSGVKGIENNLSVLPPQKARSDKNLRVILSEILKNDFPLDNNVSFNVADGIVILNGTAATLWDKENIAKDFSHILGVRDVQNHLTVTS